MSMCVSGVIVRIPCPPGQLFSSFNNVCTAATCIPFTTLPSNVLTAPGPEAPPIVHPVVDPIVPPIVPPSYVPTVPTELPSTTTPSPP